MSGKRIVRTADSFGQRACRKSLRLVAYQAMVYPTATSRRKETLMLFANPNGVQGNVVSPGVNELIIPNYKQTWAAIRKLSDAPQNARQLSFKSLE
jgi:arsenite oxidase large subunit